MNAVQILRCLCGALLLAALPPAQAASSADGAAADSCRTEYRPRLNELAFAAVGAPLKVADIRCHRPELIIPFAQKAAAVTLPAGVYPGISQDAANVYFALTGDSGEEVSSCLLCDPLRYLAVPKDKEQTGILCVQSRLQVLSCAAPQSLSFAVHQRESLKENQCTPSLVYFGRSADILRFAFNDCRSQSAPALTYDLSLGREIRFLNDRYLIVKADNQGLSYRPLARTQKAQPQAKQASAPQS